jgi:uncharacterized protein (TIGR02117 family)
MRRVKRVLLWLVVAIVAVIAAGQRFGDPTLSPRNGEATVTLQVVDYGFHVALFVPRDALRAAAVEQGAHRLVAVTDRFADDATLEFGWGDEAFYRNTPTIADFQIGLGLRAILGLNDTTVLQVVGWHGEVAAPYPGEGRRVITISARALAKMIPLLEDTLAGTAMPEDLGPGLYGDSVFYRAHGRYSLFNVCNHWTARLLNAAGLPINLTLATSSRLLVWQLPGATAGGSIPTDATPAAPGEPLK